MKETANLVLELDDIHSGVLRPRPTPYAATYIVLRIFEFVQSQWVNDGTFVGGGGDKDPIIGASGGAGNFAVPRKPVRRRCSGIPQFVFTRGGEYSFMPGIRALRWLANLQT